MIPPFIIEEILKRERYKRRPLHEQPVLELPLPMAPPFVGEEPQGPSSERGVVIIELLQTNRC